jgi:hypothetical protein
MQVNGNPNLRPYNLSIAMRAVLAGGTGALLTKLVSVAWHPPPRCPSLPAMKPDPEDNECRTAEPLSFAQMRAELLAVVMANHPEFTLEEAEKMLQEAGF